MNPFSAVRDDFGLTPENQGEAGWLYLLLTAMANAYDATLRTNTFSNPAREVLYRLEPYLTSHAGQRFEHMVSARIPRFGN